MEGPNHSIDKYLRQAACIACMLFIVAVIMPTMVSSQVWYGYGGGYRPAGGWAPMGMAYNTMAGMPNYWGMTAPVSAYAGGWARQGSGYWGSASPAWGTWTGYPAQSTVPRYYGLSGSYGTGPQAQWMSASTIPQQGWSSYAGYSAGGWQQSIADIPSGWIGPSSFVSTG